MPADIPYDQPNPDLARLLVLEAGQILEDLTPDLARRLPDKRDERVDRINSALAKLDTVHTILSAAAVCATPLSSG